MDYCPHTQGDIDQMMAAIGISDINELFADIPEKFRLKSLPDLPEALSEQETQGLLRAIGLQNRLPRVTLTGAGAYWHYIPAVVGHIASRTEFYTTYTPYQAEMSQGLLQTIYEYQTMIAHLTGLEVANASMYDGATAMAEAAVLSAKITGRTRMVVARSIHPEYRRVVQTYAWANGLSVTEVPWLATGRIDPAALAEAIDSDTAAVIVSSPNFLGCIEDVEAIAAMAHPLGVLLIAGFSDATSLCLLKPAGACGADFVVGEGQSFGNPLSYGGPYLGIFAAREKYLRRIPGRIAGATVDKNGRRGFVLTLQTREQHIRREKATSNICSNEALCALSACVYLASLGKNLQKLAALNVYKAQYLKAGLSTLRGWRPAFDAPIYNEFAMICPDAKAVNARLSEEGILGGYALAKDYPELDKALLFSVTEMVTRKDMDDVIRILK